MEFIVRYVKAETIKEKIMCFVAKVLRAHYVTPLGRIILLPKDYCRLAILTGNEDLLFKADLKGTCGFATAEASEGV